MNKYRGRAGIPKSVSHRGAERWGGIGKVPAVHPVRLEQKIGLQG